MLHSNSPKSISEYQEAQAEQAVDGLLGDLFARRWSRDAPSKATLVRETERSLVEESGFIQEDWLFEWE